MNNEITITLPRYAWGLILSCVDAQKMDKKNWPAAQEAYDDASEVIGQSLRKE